MAKTLDSKTAPFLANVQGHVGLCADDPRGLMFEAEFTLANENDAQRDLNGKSTRITNMTGPLCRDACDGYLYAGLQRGNRCYCGDEYGQHGTAEPDVAETCLGGENVTVEGRTACELANGTYVAGRMACGSPCEGDSTSMCGGRGANSIYAMTAENGDDDWIYIGCYIDEISFTQAKTYGDASLDFDWDTNTGFGLTFDGRDDYATLPNAPEYSKDGTFSIAMWFTKPTCDDPGARYQTIFSHRALDPLPAQVKRTSNS